MQLLKGYEVYQAREIYRSIGQPETLEAEAYRTVSLGQPKALETPIEEQEVAEELQLAAAGSETIFRIIASDQHQGFEDVSTLLGDFSADTIEMLAEKKFQTYREIAQTEKTLSSLDAQVEETLLKIGSIGDFHADQNWFMRKGQLEMELSSLYQRADRLRDRRHSLKLQLIDIQRAHKVCKRRVEI